MSNGDELLVKAYELDRICKPHPNIEQLTLKEVNTTESAYARTLVQLKDASLPDWVEYDSVEQLILGFVSWDLFLLLKYREDWKPSGYGLGELLYATSLLPNEELTLEVKTWETSKTQQDEEDATDIRNVSDIKSTASTAHEDASGVDTKTHEYVDAKAGYSGFGASVSVQGGWSQDVSTMQKNLAKQTQDSSQQATNEYKSTHKVKIALSRESGSEYKSTRKIKNINQTRTLTANYYEVLREYEVDLRLYEVGLILLGAEPDLRKPTIYQTWGGNPQPITLGQLIRSCQSSEWIQSFTDTYGISPIKVLREAWSAPLHDSAPVPADWGTGNSQITPEMQQEFQSTMLQYVQPSPGWIEPDGTGALRWGYEVLAGMEQAVLEYLYRFLPNSPKQLLAEALGSGMAYGTAQEAIIARYVQSLIPRYRPQILRAAEMPALMRSSSPLMRKKSDTILVAGPFHSKSISDLELLIPEWVRKIIDQLKRVRKIVDDEPLQARWITTLPTSAIYTDLSLGICSGGEDYIEVNRQFDLELKKLEIERLKLELEKMKLLNERISTDAKREIVISNATEGTGVTLNLNLGPSTDNGQTEIKFSSEAG